MKLRMSVGKQPFSGYINVDPVPKVEQDKQNQFDIRPLDFRNLENIVSNAECYEVLVDECIDYVRQDKLNQFVDYCISKLRKGGVIHISGTDIYEVSRMFFNGEIGEQVFNSLLYGMGEHPWSFKSGCHSLPTIRQLLESRGLKITNLSYDGVIFNVSARRN